MPRNPTRYLPRPRHHVYIEQDFYSRNAIRITYINELIAKFRAAGMEITQRSIFYALVSKKEIANSQAEAQALSGLITNARLAGHIDPYAIDDPTRSFYTVDAWGSPVDVLSEAARDYQRRMWDGQSLYPELYVEKDAVVGYALPKARELHLPVYSGRGYSSWPGLFDAAQRYARALQDGRLVVAFHLGDHDPSGIDMTRNIAASLWLLFRSRVPQIRSDPDSGLADGFAGFSWAEIAAALGAKPLTWKDYESEHKELFPYGQTRYEIETAFPGRLIVQRLALNLDQIQASGNFPPNPLKTKNGKLSDSRAPAYKAYMTDRGLATQAEESWELDALPVIGEATAIGDVIDDAVTPLVDHDTWRGAKAEADRERSALERMARNWERADDIVDQVERFERAKHYVTVGGGGL
jgi:hypothetical protein